MTQPTTQKGSDGAASPLPPTPIDATATMTTAMRSATPLTGPLASGEPNRSLLRPLGRVDDDTDELPQARLQDDAWANKRFGHNYDG